ncbi:hypothetical protein RhiirB3_453302 [Rhizophagus irregularis]|nr:hypothetical protein RhiirB3_453302 [Rhizophagus irregularis]
MIENKWKDFHVMDIYIKIVIDNSIQTANIVMQHDLLHIQPEKYNVSNEVKNSIRQQIHLVPKDIFSTFESIYSELTQKQNQLNLTNYC